MVCSSVSSQYNFVALFPPHFVFTLLCGQALANYAGIISIIIGALSIGAYATKIGQKISKGAPAFLLLSASRFLTKSSFHVLNPISSKGLHLPNGMLRTVVPQLSWLYNSTIVIHSTLTHAHTAHSYQEYITERVCNSHMVSTPAIWIG